jgi:hypothetical protein
MKCFFKVLAVVYSVLAIALFYNQDICYSALRGEQSPSVNFYLVSIGVLLQVLHVTVFLYYGFFGMPKIFFSEVPKKLLIIFIVFSFCGFGVVRHGLLHGDKSRAFFEVTNHCSSVNYVFYK